MAELTPPTHIPSVPSPKPPSIHGESAIHKTHWSFIAGILGIFLVLETIFMGYYYMKQVTKDDREIVAELAPEQAPPDAQATEEVPLVNPVVQGPGTGSHVVFEQEHIVGPTEPHTWLTSDEQTSMLVSSVTCKGINDLMLNEPDVYSTTGSAYVFSQLPETWALDQPAIQAVFSERVGTAGQTVLRQLMTAFGLRLSETCSTPTADYALLFDGVTNTAVLATYNPDKNYWNLSRSMNGIMDGNVDLDPEYFGPGKSLIKTSWADAGAASWRYWVTTDYDDVMVIESCVVTDEDPSGVSSNNLKVTCDAEYKP